MVDKNDLCIGAPYSVKITPDEKTGTEVPDKVIARLFNKPANLYFEGDIVDDGENKIANWTDTSMFLAGVYGLEVYATEDGETPSSQPVYREDNFVRAINASVTIGAKKG